MSEIKDRIKRADYFDGNGNGKQVLRIIMESNHSLMVELCDGGGIVIGEGRATFEEPIAKILKEKKWSDESVLYRETGTLRQTKLRPPFPEDAGHITFKFAITQSL